MAYFIVSPKIGAQALSVTSTTQAAEQYVVPRSIP